MSEALEHEIRTLRAHFWSDRDPDGRAFAPLADAYLARGDLEEALALVEDGLGRLPDYATGHLVAARVHRARGDQAAARSAVEALLGLDRGNAPGLRLLGELAEEAGEVEEAISAFQEALSREPGYADLEGRIVRLTDGAAPEVEPPAPEPPPPSMEPVGFEPTHDPRGLDGEDGLEGEGGLEGLRSEGPLPGLEDALALDDFEASDDQEGWEDVDDLGDALGLGSFEVEAAGEWGDPAEGEGEPAAEGDLVAGDPVAEGPPEADRSPPLVTRTMAELYMRQGFLERGVELYRQLSEQDPEDGDLAERLEELERTLVLRSAEEAAALTTDAEATGFRGGAEGRPGDTPDTDDPSGSAPQWAGDDPGGASITPETPFAWAPEEGEDGGGDDDADLDQGPTAARYFEDLLAWEPGAVPIASLAPDRPPPAPDEEDGDGGDLASDRGDGGGADAGDWSR